MPVTEEILDLAKHHKRILERKFPTYTCDLSESSGHDGPRSFLRVESNISPDDVTLMVLFSSRSIQIFSSISDQDETIDYADPRFTDDILSNKLEEYRHVC